MKRLRVDRWASQLQQHPPRNPRLQLLLPQQSPQICLYSHESRASPRRASQERQYHAETQWKTQRRGVASRRRASSAAAAAAVQVDAAEEFLPHNASDLTNETSDIPMNAPPHARALNSAKLSALHARLSLPAKLPIQTLARCLIDPSVDPRPGYNNAPLALLGQDLLGYYTSEHLICQYPRLPMAVLFAAQYAYVGPATLGAIRAEWGVEIVAAPGPEVDPGLLQLKRMKPGNAMAEDGRRRLKDMPQARRLGASRRSDQSHWRRGISSRIVFDDQFGDLQPGLPLPEQRAPCPGAPVSTNKSFTDGAGSSTPTASSYTISSLLADQVSAATDGMDTEPVTVETASAGFVRALAGALHLHAGVTASKDFHQAHILSRHLELHTLFNFTHPTRDLSFLCKREGFESPVARLISETARLSRHPVFIVGVFSGDDQLGEGAGSSLNEARVRAAAAALRSWYLYSPPDTDIVVPSAVEGVAAGKTAWKPQMVDMGEIVT